MLELHAADIHLWLVACDEVEDTGLLEEYARLLSDAERHRQQCFRLARHRHQYLVARAALRTVLSQYSPVQPAAWRFDRDPYGQPVARGGQASAEPVSFSMSHTDGLVLVGVTTGCELGVDAESAQTDRSALALARRFFSPEEAAALSAMPQDARADRFLEYWTLKESYIKARGLGLLIPLDLFSFHLDDTGRIGVAFRPQLGDESSRWRFWLMRPFPRHIAAICARRVGLAQRLTARKFVPLQSAETIHCAVLRESP